MSYLLNLKASSCLHNTTTHSSLFKHLKVCVLIPTYNNEATIGKVINDVKDYTNNIIVVNDGSTDGTLEILNRYLSISLISYEKNRGKGYAIKKGFKLALEKGYNYAITIDSDGQHYAHNLPAFVETVIKFPNSLIIGARNLDEEENISEGSSFANKFSNFWFRVETGIKLPDTQSGFRLYPIQELKGMHFFTNRYEFEIESIVRAAWKGIKVHSIPIDVFYPEKSERVSHFRPGRDFIRISLLNTVLVLLAFLIFLPIKFFKSLTLKNVKAFFDKYFLKTKEPSGKLAAAVALGVFFGIVPIWGFQLASALFIAHLLKLNKLIVGVAANISIPPLLPVVLFLSYLSGAFILNKNPEIHFSKKLTVEAVMTDVATYITGAISLAIVAAILFGLLTYLLLFLFRKKTD